MDRTLLYFQNFFDINDETAHMIRDGIFPE